MGDAAAAGQPFPILLEIQIRRQFRVMGGQKKRSMFWRGDERKNEMIFPVFQKDSSLFLSWVILRVFEQYAILYLGRDVDFQVPNADSNPSGRKDGLASSNDMDRLATGGDEILQRIVEIDQPLSKEDKCPNL